jgi:hypothetical protein
VLQVQWHPMKMLEANVTSACCLFPVITVLCTRIIEEEKLSST